MAASIPALVQSKDVKFYYACIRHLDKDKAILFNRNMMTNRV